VLPPAAIRHCFVHWFAAAGSFFLRFSQVFYDDLYLAGGEEFLAVLIVGGKEFLHQPGVFHPFLELGGGAAGCVTGEIQRGEFF